MNKNVFMMVTAALVAATSCNKTAQPSPAVADTFEQGVATLTVNVVDPLTKGTSSYLTQFDNERALETNFQIVAYDVDATSMPQNITTWYNVANIGSQTSFTTTMIPGNKRMLFLCNQGLLSPSVAPRWVDRSLAVSDTRDAFTATHLPLGLGFSTAYTLTVNEGEAINRDIELTHMCSRIVLRSIVNETGDARIETMVGKSISLLNVPKGLMLNGYSKEKPYYNPKGGDYSTAEKCAATTELGAGPRSFCALTYTGTNLNPGFLYSYPGSAVYMLVALDIKLTSASAAQTYYYAIPITGMQFNKSYDVTLRVRNLGSTDPLNPAIPVQSTFTVSVADWVGGPEIDELM